MRGYAPDPRIDAIERLMKRRDELQEENKRLRTWLEGIRDGTITQTSPRHAADYALKGLILTDLEE